MAEGDGGGAPRALLLTAGLGTRLRPLTYQRAKAVVPVNGVPLVSRVIGWLSAAGIRDLVLNLHHHPASIAGRIGDGVGLGVRVRYSWEQPVLGSAGGPRHALGLLADDPDQPFVIVNGDTLTDVDVAAVVARHGESGALVTMAVIENPRPEKYGGVWVSSDGYVAGFGRPGQPPPAGAASLHFIGVQVASARPFLELPDGVPAESVNSLYPALIARDPRSVAVHVSQSTFRDIGTPADCLATSLELAAAEGDRLRSPGVTIDASARLERTAVWDDVRIGAGAELHECIVGDGVSIPAGARYRRCAIVPARHRDAASGERIDGHLLVQSF